MLQHAAEAVENELCQVPAGRDVVYLTAFEA